MADRRTGIGETKRAQHCPGAAGLLRTGRDHKTDGHIDHAVDRPGTTVSADDNVLEPGPDALALPPAAAPDFVSTGSVATILVETEQGVFTQPRP
ncbi:hypothetical protein AB0H69_23920 [Streptomyces phaeochromogenes]|uniref:hypothetical protein n=1 Tax=Streptomyces phaeochromogenes TaxID=1923 RepID=UPI0033E30E29